MAFAWHVPESAVICQWMGPLAGAFIGALCDVRTHRIPNVLTGVLLVAGLLMSGYMRGHVGLLDAAAGVVIMALPFVILFLLGGGASDAKLMGAAGAWLGAANGVLGVLMVVAAGAVLGLAYAVMKRRAGQVLANTRDLTWLAMVTVMTSGWAGVRRPEGAAGTVRTRALLPVPYGTAIFSGLCMAALVRWLWLG